ncbi:VWA domain-containing protein [bacterium]|nr:VWA domain-containing protein [bacterium]
MILKYRFIFRDIIHTVLSRAAGVHKGILSFCLILVAVPVLSQVKGIKIQFLDIGITDTTMYNNLPADFPYPVLSLIQIQDEAHHYIHGLAATDEWIGPDDIAEIGLPVNDIWIKINERHAWKNYPANQNVKDMEPSFMVSELTQVAGYGVSMALAMDYSGSMRNGILDAEEAAKLLVRRINKNDKIAIIKITKDIKMYQDFTNDTTLLMDAIVTRTPDRTGTALNQGIYEAVNACANISGRRSVVVYTDGLNDMAGPTATEIINLANELGVMIFTIGLGDEIDEKDLGKIAVETGGYYRRTPNPGSLGLIYERIYHYINGFYAMAHTSTDPYYNGTLRRVDIDVQVEKLTGHGWGTYYVPFLPRNVRIQNRVVSDSMLVSQGDTLYFATSDDTVSYTLTIDCDGPGIAHDIVVKNVPDQHVIPFSYDLPPDTTIGDTLFWYIERMEGETRNSIHYNAKVSTYLPMHTIELKNHAFINCPFDSIAEDNEATSILLAKGHPDFLVRCLSNGGLASPGHPLTLSAFLSNYGNANAEVPVNVRFYLKSTNGQLIDELSVPSLNLSDSTKITGVWKNPVSGTYNIYIVADQEDIIKELREDNNQDSCIIQVGINDLSAQISEINYRNPVRDKQAGFPVPILTKINVLDQNLHTVFGLADANDWIDHSQTAESGESVKNHWTGLNESPWGCTPSRCGTSVIEEIQVTEIRRDSLSVVFVAEISNSMNGWRQQVQRDILGILNPEINDWGAVVGLGNTVQTLQTFTQDTSLLFGSLQSSGNTSKRLIYDGCIQGLDLAISRNNRRGVVVLVSGKEQGGTQSLQQVIETVQNRSVPIYLVQIGNSPYNQDFEILADTTGGWYFQVSHQDQSESTAGLLEDMLRNYYCLSFASPDTLRDETLRVVDVEVTAYQQSACDAGVYRAPAGFADLEIIKTGRAISQYLTQTDPAEQRVQPGDSITYTLSIKNTGHYDIDQILIRDQLPDNLKIAESSIPYTQSSSQHLRWMIDSLSVYQSAQILYTCFVDTVDAATEFPLINQASLIHSRDEITENNTSRDIIILVPLKGPDLNIIKTGRADSSVVFQQDTIWIADPGDTVSYTIEIINEGEMICRDITLSDTLSKWLTLVSVPENAEVEDNVIHWSIHPLASRGGTETLIYTCAVDTFVPPWDEMILNNAIVTAPKDTLLNNNCVTDTLWIVGLQPPGPQIQISKNQIQPGDSITVSAMSPIIIESWDLVIFYEDGSMLYDFGDDFIKSNPLTPGQWITVSNEFNDTYMRTGQKQEQVGFVIETTDIWGSVRSDTAFVTIRSSDAFSLDRNVFRPNYDSYLTLKFKLSSNRHATIQIFDLSGHRIKNLASQSFLAGWNSLQWDGLDNHGRTVGSGVYLALLNAGEYTKAHKFILVR